jgi:putative transposase
LALFGCDPGSAFSTRHRLGPLSSILRIDCRATVSNRMKRDLAIRALKMAIAFRAPPEGCIHHTDRGSQYCSHDYQKILRKNGFKASPLVHGNMHCRAMDERKKKLLR